MHLLSSRDIAEYLKMSRSKSYIYSQLLPQVKNSLEFPSFRLGMWIT